MQYIFPYANTFKCHGESNFECYLKNYHFNWVQSNVIILTQLPKIDNAGLRIISFCLNCTESENNFLLCVNLTACKIIYFNRKVALARNNDIIVIKHDDWLR